MSSAAKRAFLHTCKWLGLFHLASFVYRNRLQILCYHGFRLVDENRFRSSLFMDGRAFAERLAWLRRHGFRVLSLEEGLRRLKDRKLQRKSVVITVDDGFYGFLDVAVPLLREFAYPCTVYVTSYYVLHQNPIFRLAIQYAFWKSSRDSLSVGDLIPQLPGRHAVQGPSAQESMWQVIDYAERELSEPQRVELARQILARLNVDYQYIRDRRFLGLLNADEIKRLVALGFDVQLHTHRHRLPSERGEVEREILDNRQVLEPLVGKDLRHLCYPSGIWNQEQWRPLTALGIQSATTCEPGLNGQDTPLFALRRFLDREDFSLIEFEAELYGLKELLRSVKGRSGISSANRVEAPDAR